MVIVTSGRVLGKKSRWLTIGHSAIVSMLVGCSAQSFDYLTSGNGAAGDSSNTGGKVATTAGAGQILGGSAAQGGTGFGGAQGGSSAMASAGQGGVPGGAAATGGAGGIAQVGGASAGGSAQGGMTATGGAAQGTGGIVAKGGSAATGGVGITGGAKATGGVTGILQGGSVATGGVGITGGAKATGGVTSVSQGGSVATGGVGIAGSTQGGTPATGGSSQSATGGAATGGAATGGAATGGSTSTCPKYTGTGGSTLTPPSNGFESNSTGWSMLSGAAVSVTSSTSSCVGSKYLLAEGSKRAKEWDGPAVSLLSYLVSGHVYKVTLAARFDPQNAPSAAKPLTFSAVVSCTSTSVAAVYTHIQAIDTLTTWTRFSGTLPTTLTNCTSISGISVYLETATAEAAYSIDVDDFQLIDAT